MSEAHVALDVAKAQRSLRDVNITEFLNMEIPHREMLLDPIIPVQGLTMLHAPRGIGKTYLALSISYAVATGTGVLGWSAPRPRRVLYADGEMPAHDMQTRLATLVHSAALEPPDPDMWRLVTPDLCDDPIPNLSTCDGQRAFESKLEGVDLVVLDNLSTLCSYGRENEAESWQPMQTWLLDLRRRGKSVLLVHHSGKGGGQRGTSRREDVLDTVIGLRRPEGYCSTEGARFEIHFEKARSIVGDAAKPIEARLTDIEGRLIWTTRDIIDADADLILDLHGAGRSLREIAAETGISKSKVHRIVQSHEEASNAVA